MLTRYERHQHRVTLANGEHRVSYNYAEGLYYDHLLYLTMSCTVCGETVLVRVPVARGVRGSLRKGYLRFLRLDIDTWDRPSVAAII